LPVQPFDHEPPVVDPFPFAGARYTSDQTITPRLNIAEVFVLGGGTPTEFRFGSAHALRVGDEVLMFDCGPAATHKLVKAGLYPTQVDNLFFTHHHFDHNIDYPCFLLCRWDQAAGHGSELNVYGPKLTEV
jgi:ribonuclease Z